VRNKFGENYFTTGGAAGVVAAGAVEDFFTAVFLTFATFFFEEAAGAAGAAGVVAGAVCANEIPARARVIERAAMVFILCGFLFPRRCCLSASVH
jgi:hypothetical protein